MKTVISSTLSGRINIGGEIEARLSEVGIDSLEKLEKMGSRQAFMRLLTIDPEACLNLLYALEGAIEGIRWHDLSREIKQELLQFHKMAQMSIKPNK
jgi:DNA transformation protein and related proteins